jgi:hypothetical protein
MADRPGDRFALIAEAARYLVNVRHNDRDQCLGAGVNLGPVVVARVHGYMLSY